MISSAFYNRSTELALSGLRSLSVLDATRTIMSRTPRYESADALLRVEREELTTRRQRLSDRAAQLEAARDSVADIKGLLDRLRSEVSAAAEPDADRGLATLRAEALRNDINARVFDAVSGGENLLLKGLRDGEARPVTRSIDITTEETRAPSGLGLKVNEDRGGVAAFDAAAAAYDPDAAFQIPEIDGAVTIDVTVRFDDLDAGPYQRVFDFGNGASKDNVWLGQIRTTNDLAFEIVTGSRKSRITAIGAIVEGETATFTASVNDSGWMQIYKNDVLIAEGQGRTPADVTRANKLVGESNWSADAPLVGEVSTLDVQTETEYAEIGATIENGLAAAGYDERIRAAAGGEDGGVISLNIGTDFDIGAGDVFSLDVVFDGEADVRQFTYTAAEGDGIGDVTAGLLASANAAGLTLAPSPEADGFRLVNTGTQDILSVQWSASDWRETTQTVDVRRAANERSLMADLYGLEGIDLFGNPEAALVLVDQAIADTNLEAIRIAADLSAQLTEDDFYLAIGDTADTVYAEQFDRFGPSQTDLERMLLQRQLLEQSLSIAGNSTQGAMMLLTSASRAYAAFLAEPADRRWLF